MVSFLFNVRVCRSDRRAAGSRRRSLRFIPVAPLHGTGDRRAAVAVSPREGSFEGDDALWGRGSSEDQPTLRPSGGYLDLRPRFSTDALNLEGVRTELAPEEADEQTVQIAPDLRAAVDHAGALRG